MRLAPPFSRWSFATVEWSPKISTIIENIDATHFVLPDLPFFSEKDRANYFATIPSHQRIQTIATCNHTPQSLAGTSSNLENEKILLVGGNEKSPRALSTVEAARLCKHESNAELWGVTDPNDPRSVELVGEKVRAGISGFITQPLLSGSALRNLDACRQVGDDVAFVAGVAMPRSANNLHFWLKLLDLPGLEDDPMFKSHLEYFSRSCYSSLEWIDQELWNLDQAGIDGIHFMPLGNTNDLITVFQDLGECKIARGY